MALLAVDGVALLAGHAVALLSGHLLAVLLGHLVAHLVGNLVTHLPRFVVALLPGDQGSDGLLDSLALVDRDGAADRVIDGAADLLSLVVGVGLGH